ncbi:metal ABC transporter ATP-binding protein [Helcococcus kunzii]|uniref:metal ABC transporter ATP-binding protein n=1 Tax=Helcococcus kunzii TaxID=40091 RepID=UPI0024ACE9AB|nr:ATP-binding cassette domain-containing protein [Helcococcus kunzii]
MKIVEIKDLTFGYDKTEVLKDINIEIMNNDFVSLSGNNGSGKSTLLRLIIGEFKNYSGQIKIFGRDIKKFDEWHRIGYVPQIDRDNLTNFPISVREMVLLNLYYDFNMLNLPKKKHYKMVDDILKSFNILDLANENFNELSGGQKQRVMIAKAMVHKPELLIFDEPTVGIDKNSKKLFYDTLEELYKENKITIILVTHESDLDFNFPYRKIALEEKEIKEYV